MSSTMYVAFFHSVRWHGSTYHMHISSHLYMYAGTAMDCLVCGHIARISLHRALRISSRDGHWVCCMSMGRNTVLVPCEEHIHLTSSCKEHLRIQQ